MSMIGTVGLVSLVIDKPVNFAIKNVALFKTSCTPELIYYFLCFVKSKRCQSYINQHLAGSTQKYISLNELRKMPITLPTIQQLTEFNRLIKPLIEQIKINTIENKLLSYMRDTLLPKLISGEIDVSNINI